MMQKLLEAWMDLHSDPTRDELRAQFQVGAGPFHDFVQRQLQALTLANGGAPDQETLFNVSANEFTRNLREVHRGNFPFNSNLLGLIMVVQADLTEPQRERFMSTMMMRNLDI
jgi:hypothetical protein